MLSLDEPLDLKLPSGQDKGSRMPSNRKTLIASLNALRARQLHMAEDGGEASSPGSPDSSYTVNTKEREPETPPAIDLSMSPSFTSSPTPSDPADCSGVTSLFCRDAAPLQYPDALRFFLPIGTGGGLHLPSSMFSGQSTEARSSPDLSADEQLACRWLKCHLLFDSLKELVDHVNDFHVKPEKDSGYCCHWEGCARKGRGFNARYKMLIHIRTHTNEKPHRCPTCSKSFSRLENLKIHNRSHTGEKPYTCPYKGCNKRYSNSSDRFKHTRTHYVDKPYCCKMAGCVKRYTDPSSLRKHIKAHGHFVAQETLPGDEMGNLLKPGRQAADNLRCKGEELLYEGGARIVIPGAAAAALLANHGLAGLAASLPLPLDLSLLSSQGVFAFAGGFLGSCPSLGGLTREAGLCSGGMGRSQGWTMRGGVAAGALDEEDGGDPEEVALNLSMGAERLSPSWVVVPPGTVVLKPAVVN